MSYRPDSRFGDDMRADYMAVCAEEKREERRMARLRDEYQQYLDRAFGTLSAEVLSFDRWKARTGR